MMKMTKKKIGEEINKAWNTTNIIDGIKIAHVGWLVGDGYLVIENEDTFEDCTKKDFVPIDSFYYKKDMVNKLYKIINK